MTYQQVLSMFIEVLQGTDTSEWPSDHRFSCRLLINHLERLEEMIRLDM